MSVKLKSFQQILGDMIRKVTSVTGINDLNKGSVLTTLLEAAAQEDFAQYGAMIEILDNFSLDSVSGADLNKKAIEFGLTRLSATRASGFVTISDTSFTKVSTGIFIGASPPIAGDTIIKVNDASGFSVPGSLYIGRGSPNFEGPVAMDPGTPPVNNGSFWTITLVNPLVKNHNLNETIIFAQGGDRVVPSGTVVKIPKNNVSSTFSFKVANDQVVADGENTLNNVLVFATQSGTGGNAPLKSITEFDIIPFNNAAVLNLAAFSNARDLESDQELRDRIKNTIQSLSRGTKGAILSNVIGVADPDDNKRVTSASIIEPTTTLDIAELFIDDGTGFEPSFSGQGLENVILGAAGTEQFLQLGSFPLVKAQIESDTAQPYVITNGMTLTVKVNDISETITFSSSDFANEQSVRALEVVEAINNKSNLIEARTSDGQKKVVIFASATNNEKIQVTGGTANNALLFSTDPVFTLRLYKDDVLLNKDGLTAFVESNLFSNWAALASPATFNIKIDGKHTQYLRISDNLLEVSVDGTTYATQSGTTFSDLGTSLISASLSQWATVLGGLIVGASVTVNGNKLKITSNQESTANSIVQVLNLGTTNDILVPQGWPTAIQTGTPSDFTLNRFNGQIELTTPLVAGNTITAGTSNTRGDLTSPAFAGGTIDLSLDNGRVPQLFVVVDGSVTLRTLNATSGTTITVAASGSNWRYTSSVAAFTTLKVGDYVVVQDQSAGPWIGSGNTGIFRVELVDDPSGFFFEVNNPNGVAGGPATVDAATDIQGFLSTRAPQKISLVAGVNNLSTVASTINSLLVGGSAKVLDNTKIRLQTSSFDNTDGAITVPVSAGKAVNLGFTTNTVVSAVSHTASIQSTNEVGLRVSGAFGATTTADTSDPFTLVNDSTKLFTSDGTIPGRWLKYQTGINEDLKGIIRTINSNTQLLLRDNSPSLVSSDFLGPVAIGQGYQQYTPFDLEDTDNLVVVMDGDQANKTNNVPLSRAGRVSSVFTTTTFDGIDTGANTSGTSFGGALWSGYDFADYKVWFKARNVINPTNDKNAIIYRAIKFGPTGEKIRVSYDYNVAPSLPLKVTMTPAGDFNTIRVLLGTGVPKITTQDGTTQWNITTGAGTTTYTYTGTGTNPGLPVVAVGDIVTFNSANFSAGNNGTFKISATDNSTFITVFSSTGVVEGPLALGVTGAMSVFPLSGDTGASIVSAVNTSSPANLIAEAILTDSDPNATTNDGSGLVSFSTADDPAILSQFVLLVDSENWIRDFSNPVSPFFTLKRPLSFISVTGGAGNIYSLDTAPVKGTTDLGEPFKLIPLTAKNVADHMNKPAITSLPLNANIDRSDDGEKIQISSQLIGSQGEVSVTGGTGNSNLMAVQGNTALEGASLKTSVLSSAVTGFHAGQQIKISNQFKTKKLNNFDAATIITTSVAGTKSFTLNKRILGLSTIAQTGIGISLVSGNTWRATIPVGDSGDFTKVKVHDELQIRRDVGTFNSNNEGTFPIVAVGAGGGKDIDFINPDGVAQPAVALVSLTDFEVATPYVTQWPKQLDGTTVIKIQKLSQDVVRYRWFGTGTDPNFASNGIRVDDTVVIAGNSFALGNKGRFIVIGVFDDFIEVVNKNAVEESVTLNEPFANALSVGSPDIDVLASGVFTTYSIVSAGVSWGTTPKPGDRVTISGTNFNAANKGTFKVITSTGTSIKVINTGVTQAGITLIATTDMQFENSFSFFTLDSAEPGDTLSIGAVTNAWFDEKNQGQFLVSAFKRDASLNHVLEVTDTNFPLGTTISISAPATPGADRTTNVVTITTPLPHGFIAAQSITIAGVTDSSFNGTFIVASVSTPTTLTYAQTGPDATSGNGTVFGVQSDLVTLGANVSSFALIESTAFTTYRQIDNLVVDTSDTTKHTLFFSPTPHANRIATSPGSQVTSLNKLGFPETPKQGIDGYKFWTGLLRRVQRTVDGFDSDSATFPGIKAAGVQLEVKPPLLKRVSIGVTVKTIPGTPISILIDPIKSAILAYIASLGVGKDVIISEVIARVQDIPGVEAVTVTNPAPVNGITPERIILQDNEKAIAREEDIAIG